MINVSRTCLAETLAALTVAGRAGRECVVLWLGPTDRPAVTQVHRPAHSAARDQFIIPRLAVRALLDHLARNRLRAVAQVHTHPGDAFHSAADDQWAVVRHQGALSLVLPMFGLNTSADSFLSDCATFQFSANARWEAVPTSRVITCSP